MTRDPFKGREASAGFSLVELLIAISILSYGLLAVAAMQISGLRGNASAKWHTEAATWGADRIEKLMALDYDHADLNGGTHGPVTENGYSIAWSVTQDAPIPNCKTVEITINWQDKGSDKLLEFTYFKADI